MDISKLLLAFLAYLEDGGLLASIVSYDEDDTITYDSIIEEFLDGYPPI